MEVSDLVALNIPEGKSGDMRIEHKFYPRGHTFPTYSARTVIMSPSTPRIHFTFRRQTRWHSLLEGKDGVWMTDLPIEQAQILPLVSSLTGRVLVGGLGLGMAATMLTRLPSVREIVVVERSPDVVALVAEHVAHPKIRVVTASIEDYLREAASAGEQFDSAFYDVWAADGETTFHQQVVPLRRASRGVVSGPVTCWNEDVMRGQLSLGLLSLVLLRDPSREGALRSLAAPDSTEWFAPFLRAMFAGRIPVDRLQQCALQFAAHYGLGDSVDQVDETGTWIC